MQGKSLKVLFNLSKDAKKVFLTFTQRFISLHGIDFSNLVENPQKTSFFFVCWQSQIFKLAENGRKTIYKLRKNFDRPGTL